MSDTFSTEIWLAVDDNSNSYISTESATDAISELIRENESEAARVVKITVNVPLPVVHETEVTVTATDAEPQVTVEA
jgi:hypothetical protein